MCKLGIMQKRSAPIHHFSIPSGQHKVKTLMYQNDLCGVIISRRTEFLTKPLWDFCGSG